MTRDAYVSGGLAHLDRQAHRSTASGLWLDPPPRPKAYVRNALAILLGLALLVAAWVAT